MSIPDGDGGVAQLASEGLWLSLDDFINAEEALGELGASQNTFVAFRGQGFPRDWPASYSSAGLKALIGKKGQIPAKRALGTPLRQP